jgi:hypothetical protein
MVFNYGISFAATTNVRKWEDYIARMGTRTRLAGEEQRPIPDLISDEVDEKVQQHMTVLWPEMVVKRPQRSSKKHAQYIVIVQPRTGTTTSPRLALMHKRTALSRAGLLLDSSAFASYNNLDRRSKFMRVSI